MSLSTNRLQNEAMTSLGVLLNVVGMRGAGEGFESWVGLLFPPGNNHSLMMLLLQEKLLFFVNKLKMCLLDF